MHYYGNNRLLLYVMGEGDTRAMYHVVRTTFKAMFFVACAVFFIHGISQLFAGTVAASCLIGFAVAYMVRMIGVSPGFHRLATHGSFKTNVLIKAVLLIAGSTAIQGSVTKWILDHTHHHGHSDQPNDIHSPYYIGQRAVNKFVGLYHSHFGWIWRAKPYADLGLKMLRLRRKDPVLAFVDKTYAVWAIAPFAISYLIGGWQMVMWVNFVCLFATYMFTWTVNSLGHWAKQRRESSNDHSQNYGGWFWWLFSLLTAGESLHGNHHDDERAANFGRKPVEIAFDPGTWVIWCLERSRLAWSVNWSWQRAPRQTQLTGA